MIAQFDWELSKGQIIEDRYVLDREVGAGGMGCVYSAFDEKLERQVAVKFLDPRLVTNEESVIRFQREALAAGRIGNPNICDVRDRGETEDGIPYIVMELLEGKPLNELLDADQPLDPLELGKLMLQTLAALQAAHEKQIIHRDLKPANIFVTEGLGEQQWVKLLDFGVSKFITDSADEQLTRSGVVLGTAYYMSPEQARSRYDIDHRTDLWSVGVILYEGLTGRMPFNGDNYTEILVKIVTDDIVHPTVWEQDIPREFEAVVLRALEKDPDNRYSDAVEFAEDLARALAPLDDERTSGLGNAFGVDGPRRPSEPSKEQGVELAPTLLETSRAMPNTIQEGRRGGSSSGRAERDGERGESEAESPPITEAQPRTREASRRRWPYLAVVVLVVLTSGLTFFVMSMVRGSENEASHSTATSEPPAESARLEPPTAADTMVEVRLEGIPAGARVSFEGAPTSGNVVRGVEGTEGELQVEAVGYEALVTRITLAPDMEIDLSERLRAVAGQPEGGEEETPLEEEREESREERRAKRRRDARRENAKRHPHPVRGPEGTRVVTEYDGL